MSIFSLFTTRTDILVAKSLKSALLKSPIPSTHAFLIRRLREHMFDPIWHFHSEYQLFSVLKGNGTRFIGDNIKPFKDSDLTFTGPNLPHLWQSRPMEDPAYISEGIVVYFNEDLISHTLLQKEELIRIRQFLRISKRGIEVKGNIAGRIQKMMIDLIEEKGFKRVLLLFNILDILSRCQTIELLASSGYTNTLRKGDTERMNKVYSFTMKNFQRKIQIAELASLTNMSSTSFSRYFKTHANKTFSDFLSEIRIGHACKLLIEDRTNISQACYESGFQTLSNFNRQFKKLTKRTPLAYRKEYEMT